MDKTIDRWTDPDGNGYAFKDTVARAQNRATIDKMNTETADRKSELDIERKRIDNLIKELPATAGEYQQSKLVLHSYDNTAVKCTTTSGNYTNVPAFTTDQGGPLSSLYTKKSNYQIAVNKSGLYLFELRIHVNSLIANKRVELAPFVNDTRNAALASSYNTAGNFTLTQVAALPLWLSANDTVDFRIAPIEAAEVSLQLGDVLVYAIDWEDKFKIPDYTGYAAETKDIRTGADGTVYGTAGEAVRKQIGNLTEDLADIESKFEIETEAFVNKCSIIRNNTPNNFIGNQVTGLKQYFDFGKNATLTKIKMNIKASNDDTVVLEIATLDDNIIVTAEKTVTTEYTDVVFDLENIVIKEPVSVFAYTKGTSLLSYGSYGTPYDNPPFSYTFPDGTRKLAFKFATSGKINLTTSDNKSCLVLFFDYTSKIIKNIPDSISQNIDTTLLKSGKAADAKVVGDKLSKLEKDINFNNAHTIFVSTSGSDETGDGTEENPYATIYKANETITDSSETNKYEIIVKQGTYTDLQEKYSGVDGNRYQGVVCKPYVTYRSENILKPDLCVLKWDGADGYTKPVTDANCVNKCLFHIPTNSKGIYIKGFTFESKNTRYCMHIETTGSTDECDWHFENCVFNWGGRPDTAEDGTVATACIGTGYSMLEFGEFINCVIKCTNTNHANHMVFQSHDNPDNIFTSIKCGEHLRFENCYFSIADGSDYAHIDLRTTKTSPIIPSFAEFINCSGIKLYVPSQTYKKSFVCTEQHIV